jgi:hypothetical protein
LSIQLTYKRARYERTQNEFFHHSLVSGNLNRVKDKQKITSVYTIH